MNLSTRMTQEITRLADRAGDGYPTTLVRKTNPTMKALRRRGLVNFVNVTGDPKMAYARLTGPGAAAALRATLGGPVTREWTYTLEDGRVMTASVRLVPHTNPAHIPRSPYDRYTVYMSSPAKFTYSIHSTRKGAMSDVECFTERMDAWSIMTRTK